MGDESPKNKVKFLCSHGGKVLPRPSDGLLKYVGGETRVVSVSRQVTFSELMKKLSDMFDGDMVLKYQLMPEDLDALVSVRTDEDLKHMIEEHDRHQTGLLRAFLVPSKPVTLDNAHSSESYMLEQRYIDAINGIMRTSPRARGSASSTPKSTSPDAAQAGPDSFPFHPSPRFSMHRVRSSPSLSNLSAYDHPHHHHPLAHSSRPPQDPQVGIGRPLPIGKTDMMNTSSAAAPSYSRGGGGGGGGGYNFYYSPTRSHKAPSPSPYAYQEDSAAYGPVMLERIQSFSRSPRKSIWD